MLVAIGSDHAGYDLKSYLVGELERLGHEVLDVGTHSTESVDYPVFCAARRPGRRVRATPTAASSSAAAGRASSSRPTRWPGCARRCATSSTPPACRASTTTPTCCRWAGASWPTGLATEILELWLATPFDGGRHQRRIDQLLELEATFADPAAQDAYLQTLLAAARHRPRAGHGRTRFPRSPHVMPWPTDRDTELFDIIERGGRAPEHHPAAHRLGELRLAGRAGGHGLGPHQQVLRGLPGQALLRRQRGHRRGRGPGPRPGQGAVRGRARQRAAPLRRQRQPGRLPGAARAGRHRAGHAPRPRRPPHARLAGQRQRPPLPVRLLRRHRRVRRAASTSTRCRDLARARAAEADRGRRHRLPADHRPGALPRRSPTRSARCSCSTPPTSPGSSPAARTRTRCRIADVVTFTTHKTLRGPAWRLHPVPRRAAPRPSTRPIFPGLQGGPLEHVIAAKAVAFREAAAPVVPRLRRPDRAQRRGPGRGAGRRRASASCRAAPTTT